MSRLIALGVGLAAIAFFTLFANSIPQTEKRFDEAIAVGEDIGAREMAALGERVFSDKGGCTTCHRVGAVGDRAPDLATVGARAAERVGEAGYDGQATDAEGYIRESLVSPCAYVVEGFECIMPPVDKPPVNLDAVEMALIIAYLQSLSGVVTVSLPAGEAPPTTAPAQTPTERPTTPQGIVDAVGCGICHSIPGLENAAGQIGPPLGGIGAAAAATLGAGEYAGGAKTVGEYLRESVLAPNTYVAKECPTPSGGTVPCVPGLMPRDFGERLTAGQLEVLIAYLAGLEVQ
jgi:hypothetical protein